MKNLDEQEIKIIKELIKDPRISDNQLGKNTKVPIKTVNRKRKLLEQEGIIRYYVSVNMGRKGTGRFGARQLHIIKFKLGITREQIINEFIPEKKIKKRGIGEPVRLFHNYLPFMNMDSGKIKKDWSTDFIFVE